uniref:Aspartate racemase n=1 Tax=Strombidium inclinatum TaxID=197538 RepID=A0A7S3IXX3_9SPIT|mmetsp:Transcript_8564/g.13226  ORF Transcript_8564/g.13226 Transcript_8564/m.13226 type:complete len:211 (+) Transcript_8564:392-1024(+)|eukprot:CAMPEP_0170500102 /NCGR_PEP_ID=MMETSP0208-20121228/33737_1 /TAXON_ID=197538 /ORGANISM="Strombidium inclinatum, Strain S3" /LENGTH=210 /DNA_ID=CAMNT_0010777981 /DNA_START=300 /DNA_END=932 /DNA_ORIENTATION=-
MSKNLKRANVDFVVCACNTAHAFQKDIEEGCGEVPFVSMIEVTSNKVLENIEQTGGSKKCGILGGGGCIEAGLFQRSLSARGIEPVTPCKENQDLLQSIIYRIKAGDKGDEVIQDFVTLLKELKEENNCSQIILGCTELPLIIEESMAIYDGVSAENLVDSSEVMVEAVVRIAKGDLEIEQAMDFSSEGHKEKSSTAEILSTAASAELAE